MNKFLLSVVTAALSATTASAAISPQMQDNLTEMQRDGIAADSAFGRHLLHQSRRAEQGASSATDMSFVSGYSIKFMGCHRVTQWASEGEQEEAEESASDWDPLNGRVRSKGLVRYRLCPSEACSDSSGGGCRSGYGEYVVDMETFLEAYIAWQVEANASKCAKYSATCAVECSGSSKATCYQKCYKKYGVNAALCSKNSNGNSASAYSTSEGYAANAYLDFDLQTYIGCAEYDVAGEDGEEIAHYLGPYCAEQGGDLRLDFFMDKTCSVPSTYDADYMQKKFGLEIPYSKTSLVETHCLSCASTAAEDEAQGQQNFYNYDANGNANYYVAEEVNELCGALYTTSGKCETDLDPDDQPYPEEGACTYIEGVQRLPSNGVVRSQQRSSKPAAVAIGVFTGIAVLQGGYVFYLRSVLKRSQVNLSGASTALA